MGSSVRYWKYNWGLAGQKMCAEGSGEKMKAKQESLQEANGLWGFQKHVKIIYSCTNPVSYKLPMNRSQRCYQQEGKGGTRVSVAVMYAQVGDAVC